MISARMQRPAKVLLITTLSIVTAAIATACGTERISVPKSSPLYQGAVLFSQRCSGCHTLSYAATHGSAPNIRTAAFNQGPNFNIRCERPVARVLYAIENGGFSGAIMPQNVVVGQQAMEVAEFVATYAGRQAPKVPGVQPCMQKPIGTIAGALAAVSASDPRTTAATATTATTAAAKPATATTKAKAAGRAGPKQAGAKSKSAHT